MLKTGDDLLEALETAQPGASVLLAATASSGAPTTKEPSGPKSKPKNQFSVIVEARQGVPTWPRYLIWTGPAYDRWYCSLESTSDGKIKAVHLGPIDSRAEAQSFVESMLEDWLG
ncbi:MAG: hypothetical protein QM784_28150 [Polyangiaceae bacterium]